MQMQMQSKVPYSKRPQVSVFLNQIFVLLLNISTQNDVVYMRTLECGLGLRSRICSSWREKCSVFFGYINLG